MSAYGLRCVIKSNFVLKLWFLLRLARVAPLTARRKHTNPCRFGAPQPGPASGSNWRLAQVHGSELRFYGLRREGQGEIVFSFASTGTLK